MGVYYPPHWLLYGLLPPEARVHGEPGRCTRSGGAWGPTGRRGGSGSRAAGSALGGLRLGDLRVLPDPPAAPVGLHDRELDALGLGPGLVGARGRGDGRASPFLLAARPDRSRSSPATSSSRSAPRSASLILAVEQAVGGRGAVAAESRGRPGRSPRWRGAFPLAAMQLWPTFRLARLAGARRDFEYLSGFAATPLHLVTFLAPGLFQRSPLWRPLVWDPFHTSPEEYLGLRRPRPPVPGARGDRDGVRGRRRPCGRWRSSAVVDAAAQPRARTSRASGPDPAARLLVLPGPGAVGLATSLALCLPGGDGFDGFAAWPRPGRRSLGSRSRRPRPSPALVVAADRAGAGEHRAAGLAGGRLGLRPRASTRSPGREPVGLRAGSSQAAAPADPRTIRVEETWARQGVGSRDAPRPVFVEQRFAIYRQELAGVGAVLCAAARGSRRWRERPAASRRRLVVLTAARPLAGWAGIAGSTSARSALWSRRARSWPGSRASRTGTRTVDPLRNLPMVAGAAPVSAYRTLDLPALGSLTAPGRATRPAGPRRRSRSLAALRATGAGVRDLRPVRDAASWTSRARPGPAAARRRSTTRRSPAGSSGPTGSRSKARGRARSGSATPADARRGPGCVPLTARTLGRDPGRRGRANPCDVLERPRGRDARSTSGRPTRSTGEVAFRGRRARPLVVLAARRPAVAGGAGSGPGGRRGRGRSSGRSGGRTRGPGRRSRSPGRGAGPCG